MYASPCRLVRDNLWLYLTQLARLLKVPWLLEGDFNQVLDPSEKWGAKPVTLIQTASI